MGQKEIIRFWWESGLSSASRNHLTTFCRPFVHYEYLRLCSAIVHFIRNNMAEQRKCLSHWLHYRSLSDHETVARALNQQLLTYDVVRLSLSTATQRPTLGANFMVGRESGNRTIMIPRENFGRN